VKVRRILIPLALLAGIGSGIFYLGKKYQAPLDQSKIETLDRGQNLNKPPELTKPLITQPPTIIPPLEPAILVSKPSTVSKTEIDISERFKRLEELAGKDIIELDNIELFPSPENFIFDPEKGYGCTRIETSAGESGYIDAWMPKGIIDMTLAGGEEFNENLATLYGVFPAPSPNIYFEVTDSIGGISYGKLSNGVYLREAKSYLYNFVWNNGAEEFYMNQGGFLYLVDKQGIRISPNPIWKLMTESTGNSDYFNQEMLLVNNPSIRLTLGSHMGSYEFFIRLRSSCPGGDMLPRFLRVNQDNFAKFVRKAYGKDY